MADRIPTLVILAGGSSSRLWPLREKSLIRFMDVPLLEHQLKTYVELGIRRVLVICNPDNRADIEQVLANFGNKGEFWDTTVQQQPRGMGDALLTLEPVLLADPSAATSVYICQVHDIFQRSFHQEMLRSHQENPQAALLASYEVEEYFPGGYLVLQNGAITNIIEKPDPKKAPSNLVNIVAHIHPDLRRLLERVKAEYSSPKAGDDHYERAMASLMTEMVFKPVPYRGA